MIGYQTPAVVTAVEVTVRTRRIQFNLRLKTNNQQDNRLLTNSQITQNKWKANFNNFRTKEEDRV